MNRNTLKITTGALFIAIFTILLFINRQTGMMLQDLIMFVLPVPIVAYATTYGFKSSLPVMAGMVLMSFLFGTYVTIMYAIAECAVGIVLGTCLYKKEDQNKTLLLTILVSIVGNVICTVVIALISGINIESMITEYKEMVNQFVPQFEAIAQQNGASFQFPEEMLSGGFIISISIFMEIVLGALQGYIVYAISLLVLKRMKFQVQKPKNLFEIYPPKWTGILAGIGAYFYYKAFMAPFENETYQIIAMSAGSIGLTYLIFFGFLAASLLAQRFLPDSKIIRVVVVMLLFVTMPQIYLFLGLLYVVTSYHREYMEGRLFPK